MTAETITSEHVDRRRAARTGERLRGDLRALVAALPLEARNATGAARWSGVSRPVCQRIIAATRHRADPLGCLRRLPGLQGLTSFVRAAADRGLRADLIQTVEASVAEYASLLDYLGGSQTDVFRALDRWEAENAFDESVDAEDSPDDPRLAARIASFNAMRRLSGREYEGQWSVFLYAPSRTNPGGVDSMASLGLIGVRLGENPLPICPIGRFVIGLEDHNVDPTSGLGDDGASGLPLGKLADFCSDNCPDLVARQAGHYVTGVVETAGVGSDPFDLVIVNRQSSAKHPAAATPPIDLVYLIDNGPSRALGVFVLLHKSLARQSVQGAGAYIRHDVCAARGNLAESPADRWQDRLPDGPRLECLGPDFRTAPSFVYDRMPELLSELLRLGDYRANDFLCYRVQTHYPVWNCPYLIWMDYSPEDTPDTL
ncbi:MAG: hypothetical protein KDA32_02740 [Phycisphaerales bacterium]|nr:hypothetical protein [Phycisphaerales bacterium]